MPRMYLKDVEDHRGGGSFGKLIREMHDAGQRVPQIMHLFAFKPEATDHLARFSQGAMRGPSPLSPGQRELIAAFTSRRNDCPF